MPEPFDRQHHLARLKHETFDLLVIGGGITGTGVALDATTRGLKVALVEKGDFASGTSSKSSKLIHGGLRYLQQGDVRLVYEALRERRRLMHNAPNLVRVLPFMIPILTKDGLISRKIARAFGSALWMYDFTGGWRIGKFHRRLRAKAALGHMPTMPADRLAAAYLYYDAEADDARLCLAVAQTASDRGAVVMNRAKVTSLKTTDAGKASGAVVQIDGELIEVSASCIVNAAGVWLDEIHSLENADASKTIRPAKGIHITLPWEKVRNDIAIVIPVPKDKRSLFVVPWLRNQDGTYQFTYVGTTDTDFAGDISDPQCTKDDINYVLSALNHSLTTPVTSEDITGVWAGLRPLVATPEGQAAKGRTADLSRRHKVSVGPSGVISISGGKLTTYREMAEDTVDLVQKQFPHKKISRCRTRRLVLRDDPSSQIAELIKNNSSLADPLIPGLPYTKAHAINAVRNEMATTLEDVLSRRTRALLVNRRATVEAALDVAKLIAPELGWDLDQVDREVMAFTTLCGREELAATLSESEYAAVFNS